MTYANKTRLSIVSGFLGAGKTTFIKKLIKDIYKAERVIVLENEFGKIDLDSGTLARENIRVESIKDGCICCSSKALLSVSVKDLIEKYHPDSIIIEPTGLAQLTDVLEGLREPYIREHCDLRHIVTIVDARNFYTRMNISKVFFENQILASRLIILSKTGGLDKKRVAEVTESIQSIHPGCRILCDDWEQMPLSQWEAALALSGQTVPAAADGASRMYASGAATSDLSYEAGIFQNFTWENDSFMELADIENFFGEFEGNHFGEIYRAKGIFQTTGKGWYTCEFVPGEVRIEPLQNESPAVITGEEPLPSQLRLRICIIGLRLFSGKLRNSLLAVTKKE